MITAEQKRVVHKMAQGTPEWFKIRAGVPSASEWDAIITPLFKPRKGDGVETYLAKKLAERWTGSPLASFYGGSMEQGSIKEERAIPFYEFTFGREIKQVGFVTTADGKIGCSPDGLFSDGGGIEIKCPEAHTHCGYLLDGVLPPDYVAQVAGNILVNDAPYWEFMSFCPRFPEFLIRVERNDSELAILAEALDSFNERLDKAYAFLVELNRGEPAWRVL